MCFRLSVNVGRHCAYAVHKINITWSSSIRLFFFFSDSACICDTLLRQLSRLKIYSKAYVSFLVDWPIPSSWMSCLSSWHFGRMQFQHSPKITLRSVIISAVHWTSVTNENGFCAGQVSRWLWSLCAARRREWCRIDLYTITFTMTSIIGTMNSMILFANANRYPLICINWQCDSFL